MMRITQAYKRVCLGEQIYCPDPYDFQHIDHKGRPLPTRTHSVISANGVESGSLESFSALIVALIVLGSLCGR